MSETQLINANAAVSLPKNKEAVSLSVPRENELSLDLEMALLTSHLKQFESSEELSIGGIIATADALAAVQKTRLKIDNAYGPEAFREFHQLTIETLKAILKARRKRFSFKLLTQRLAEMVPEESESALLDALVLLRRLQNFTGTDNPAASIALCQSSRKLIPLVIKEKIKNGELLSANDFKRQCIMQTVGTVNACLIEKFGTDTAAEITQEFTNALATKLE